MRKIVYMKFGSHLYGTDTPVSDIDYKGVYMPTKRELLLCRFKPSINSSTGNDSEKNKAGDIDDEIFSLHQFIKLACEGQTVAMDMIHAPDHMLRVSSDVWSKIVANKDKLYTKNLNAFVGYCRKQAAKYGIKGSRLSDARSVHSFLSKLIGTTKMRDVWDELPTGEHIHFLPPNDKDTNNCRIYQVCGKKFLETVKVEKVIESLDVFINEFGHRAKLAEQNQGIDWKAVSHAMRAAYQLEQIYTEGNIVFPLRNAQYIKDVKLGKLDYLTQVAPKLEELMENTERLSESCSFPEKVDTEFWDDFLFEVMENELNR